MMQVRVDAESGRLFVAYFSDQHNHPVLNLQFSSMLPGHRRMTEADIEQMNDMRKGGISTPHIHSCLASLAGGYENIPFTARDMHNATAKQRKEGGLDADSCLAYLRECRKTDPAFYFKEVIDEERVLTRLFWCDGRSKIDYQLFGDVLAFDATYNKNVYLAPLVVFSSVNHHNQTVIFAATLVVDEKEETYVWLLEQLKIAMNDKSPISIITDGDRQMKKAIDEVFPNAHHSLCAWHLLHNATSNIGKPKFTAMFKRFMLGDYEVGTFRRKWFDMVEEFGVAEKRWIRDMYDKRHSWATTLIRGKFFAGFRTTSRCEGLHAVVARYVKSRHNYTEFLCHFQRCVMYIRAKEVEADFECAKGDPVMQTIFQPLESYAATKYTRSIFYLFVPILGRTGTIRVLDSIDTGSYLIYTVRPYSKQQKEWRVVSSYELNELRCSCLRMECFGVPCEHILAVLVFNNVFEIPDSLILHRWTKDVKADVIESMGLNWDSLHLTQHWCLMDWYRKVAKAACHKSERFRFARDLAMLILKHF